MTEPAWTLRREDDNGNLFVVERYPDEASATEAAREFEAKGHEQRYWVEPPG